MKHKKLTLSIVIPVYNEQDYIGNCLDSIAKQSVRPDQVVVVDNNSTDNTVKIAMLYDFVTVIYEKRQSQVFAQKTGFDFASKDIIGRIDADAILPTDWVKNLKKEFIRNPSAIAVSGLGEPYDVPLKTLGVAAMRSYLYMAGKIAGHRMIWGSNCAILASSWQNISAHVLQRPDIWEDYDLAFRLSSHGAITTSSKITVKFSGRSAHRPLTHQYSYQYRSLRTFFLNTSFLRAISFAVLAHTLVLLFPLAALDNLISRWSQSRSLAPSRLKLAWLSTLNRNID